MGVPRQSLLETKRQLIIEPVRESIKKSNGHKDPAGFANILIKAVKTLHTMLNQRRYMSSDEWAKVWGQALGEFISGCIKLATGLNMDIIHERSEWER